MERQQKARKVPTSIYEYERQQISRRRRQTEWDVDGQRPLHEKISREEEDSTLHARSLGWVVEIRKIYFLQFKIFPVNLCGPCPVFWKLGVHTLSSPCRLIYLFFKSDTSNQCLTHIVPESYGCQCPKRVKHWDSAILCGVRASQQL